MDISNIHKIYIIKFSKREYLEQIKDGKIYFKEAKFFKNIEENHVGDTREGKIRVNPKTIPNSNNIILQIMKQTEEVNLSYRKEEKTPIFCCSIIDERITSKIDDRHFDFKKEFIEEMKKWGNSFILINLGEFLYKLSIACKRNKIDFFPDKVKYDQDERVLSYNEALLELYKFPILAFFHKTKNYKWQNEFRIALYSNDKKRQIISEDQDSYTFDIDPLNDAVIYEFDDLFNIGIKLIEKDKC